MGRGRFVPVAVFAWTILLAGVAWAQEDPSDSITDTYPFGYSHAVAGGSDGDTPLVFSGFGGGIVVTDATNQLDPKVWTEDLTRDPWLRTHGFVREMVVRDDFLYLAAWNDGLVIFRRSDHSEAGTSIDAAPANALDVIEVDDNGATKTFAVVGTDEADVIGTLHLVDVSDPGNPLVVDSVSVGAPIFAVELISGINPGTITALVGVACTGGQGSGGLLRYEIDIASTSIPANPEEWSAGDPVPVPTFVRDIEVLQAGGTATAYVGTFAGTIHKIVVQPAQLQEQLDATWPLTIPFDRVTGLSLANYGVGPQLFVAAGPLFHVERQYWGAADVPASCDQSGRSGSLEGILQYDLTTGVLEGSVRRVVGSPTALHGHPIAISTRPVLSDPYAPTILIDVACDVGGIQLFRSDFNPFAGWTLAKTSEFGAGDGVALGAYDDVLVLAAGPAMKPFVIAAREIGVAVFDPDPNMGASPLDETTDTAGGGAILLTGFDYDSGD